MVLTSFQAAETSYLTRAKSLYGYLRFYSKSCYINNRTGFTQIKQVKPFALFERALPSVAPLHKGREG